MLKKIVTLVILLYSVSIFAQNGISHLKLSTEKVDFGKTLYLQEKTQKISFKNIGNSSLIISHIDSLKPPFFSTFHEPDTLKKGGNVQYEILYKPINGSRDSQRVFINTECVRKSHSIGLLFDISSSMEKSMPNEPNHSRLSAARIAARLFIKSMIYSKDIKDEAAVFLFGDWFSVAQDFTTNKRKLLNALPVIAFGGTAFYDACIQSLSKLKNRKNIKVLIVLTDGKDESSFMYTEKSVIDFAKRYKIKIFTIGIGSRKFESSLSRIARETGGMYFDATTMEELRKNYKRIFNQLSIKDTKYFDVVGNSPQAVLSLDCPTDTTTRSYGDTLKYTVLLDSVYSESAQGKEYEIVFSFNRTLLYPLNTNFQYNKDGTVSFFGKVDSDIYTSPLYTFSFLTLVGDEPCTNVHLEKIIWKDDDFYVPLKSNAMCKICINSCARTLSQVQLVMKNVLKQNTPNPVSGSSTIDFIIENEGHYKIEVFDIYGNTVKTLLDRNLKKGEYSVIINSGTLSAGTYFYSLSSTGTRQTKRMVVID